MVDSTAEASDDEAWAPLADLSRVPIGGPVADHTKVVDRALQRVLRSLHDRDGVISSFGSFVSND
jgi:hypothetical protein